MKKTNLKKAEEKSTTRVKRARRSSKTKEEIRDEYLRKKYGVGLDYYNQKFTEQKEACICGRKPKEGKNLNLDHNHQTGEARGLLCFTCNLKCLGPLEKYNKEPYKVSILITEYFKKYGTKDKRPEGKK